MKLKQMIRVFFILLIIFGHLSDAYAFSNCQVKYDSDKRALPALKGMCNVCHLSANGSGPQNEFGVAFKNAGFKITNDLVAKFPDFFQKQVLDNLPSGSTSSSGEILNNPTSGSTSSSGEALKPVISRIKPGKVKTNVQTMISIMGKNFVNGAKTFVDNNEAITTFKSNVLLFADFILNTVGKHEVKVQNPDEQESNTVKVKSK